MGRKIGARVAVASLAIGLSLVACGSSSERGADGATLEVAFDGAAVAEATTDAPEPPDIRDAADEPDGRAETALPDDGGAPDLGSPDLGRDTAPDQPDAAEVIVGPDVPPPTGTLEVWTFNILNPANPLSEGGDVELRTQMVIDAILDRQPDLIALQEVVQSGTIPNRAEFIAAAVGYQWAWKEEYSLFVYDEGIAVLSRWPILEVADVELPHQDLLLFTRYALAVRVDSPLGVVDLYCTHMMVGGSEEQSADQALTAYQFISQRSADLPALFAGDLNAEPDTLSMRFLRGEASHDGVTGDLVDAWLATNPADPGYTIDSADPHDRIDYIYLSATGNPPLVPESCELIFAEPEGGVYASDHIGVACRVKPSGV